LIGESLTVLKCLASILNAISSLMSHLSCGSRPNLFIKLSLESQDFGFVKSFKLILSNNGKKSAEDVKVGLQSSRGSGVKINPKENLFEIRDQDCVWKGILLKHPGWEGSQLILGLKDTSLHPGNDIPLSEVLVDPEWSGWGDCKWTSIKYSIFAKDSKESTGTIHIPIRGTILDIWVTRD